MCLLTLKKRYVLPGKKENSISDFKETFTDDTRDNMHSSILFLIINSDGTTTENTIGER